MMTHPTPAAAPDDTVEIPAPWLRPAVPPTRRTRAARAFRTIRRHTAAATPWVIVVLSTLFLAAFMAAWLGSEMHALATGTVSR